MRVVPMMNLKCDRLTQSAINFAVSEVQHMLSYALQDMKDEVHLVLKYLASLT